MKIRNRIAISTSLIVALTLTGASALIYWNVWREDQGGNYESTTKSLFGFGQMVFDYEHLYFLFSCKSLKNSVL